MTNPPNAKRQRGCNKTKSESESTSIAVAAVVVAIPVAAAVVAAAAVLRLMKGVKHETFVPLTISNIFTIVSLLVKKNTTLINAGDFEAINFYQTCVDAMKDSDDRNWEYDINKRVWNGVTRLFSRCLQHNLFSTQNNNNLKLVVSFHVEYIKRAPNDAFKSNAFAFLHKACDAIGNTEMISIPGLMSSLMATIGSILDPITSNGIEDGTKNTARALMKKLS